MRNSIIRTLYIQAGYLNKLVAYRVLRGNIMELGDVHLRSSLPPIGKLGGVGARFDERLDAVKYHYLKEFGNGTNKGYGAFSLA